MEPSSRSRRPAVPDSSVPRRKLSSNVRTLTWCAVFTTGLGVVLVTQSDRTEWAPPVSGSATGGDRLSTTLFLGIVLGSMALVTLVTAVLLIGAIRYPRGFLRISANANYLRRLTPDEYSNFIFNAAPTMWSIIIILMNIPVFVQAIS